VLNPSDGIESCSDSLVKAAWMMLPWGIGLKKPEASAKERRMQSTLLQPARTKPEPVQGSARSPRIGWIGTQRAMRQHLNFQTQIDAGSIRCICHKAEMGGPDSVLGGKIHHYKPMG
jgi:hypothetical protein